MRTMFSSGFGEHAEVDILVVLDGHAHEGVAVEGHTPASGVRDAGDEAPDVEALEGAVHTGGEAALGLGIGLAAG